jgi:hypothetical protein
MRTLKLDFPNEALSTLDTFLKQTKEGVRLSKGGGPGDDITTR